MQKGVGPFSILPSPTTVDPVAYCMATPANSSLISGLFFHKAVIKTTQHLTTGYFALQVGMASVLDCAGNHVLGSLRGGPRLVSSTMPHNSSLVVQPCVKPGIGDVPHDTCLVHSCMT